MNAALRNIHEVGQITTETNIDVIFDFNVVYFVKNRRVITKIQQKISVYLYAELIIRLLL